MNRITTGSVAVLLVEDDEDDYLLTRDMLGRQDRTAFSVEWRSTFDDALEAIEARSYDVYLFDYRLGERTGLDLIREGFTGQPPGPVIVLTGQNDYRVDSEASTTGVTDFLLKQELTPYSLERSLRYAIHHHQALQDLAASEARYALAARAVNDGIWDWDLRSGQLYFSPRWQALLGRCPAASAGTEKDWFSLVHDDDLEGLRLAIEAHLSGRTSLLQAKHRMRRADGSWRWMLTRGVAVDDATGTPVRMAGSLTDITASRHTERQLQHDALHDSLTGLPNRALFMDRLERAVLRGRQNPDSTCAVLFLDADRFKLVNDTFSHSVGDLLLVALAGRISRELRPADTVSRLAGDEFAVLLEDIPAGDAEHFAAAVTARLSSALAEEFHIDGHRLFVTASTGIALPRGQASAADLLRNADIAMYEAKHRGSNRFAIFDDSMHRRVADRLTLENQLREAVERSLLEVHYQPVVDLTTGRIRGFEALARWPAGWPPVSPSEFIPVAEETGLITALGHRVLLTALEDLASWRRRGLIDDSVQMSVNVSSRQLDDPGFPDQVVRALADTGVPGGSLRLEITEGTLMREPERMARVVSEVCGKGVELELDDFGTGYSSLSALHQFPVGALKIDRCFVTALTLDGDAIVRSTVALGHSLGLEVIAEGIEEPVQLERLRELGCDYGQGYLFARPQNATATTRLLHEWSTMPAR